MSIEDWKSQIKRGTLEFAVLSMIKEKNLYGYEIICELDRWPILSAKENTIYPLLRRLLKDGYLTSYWQETAEGVPARKYYAITKEGQNYLEAMADEWGVLLASISELRGEVCHG